MIKFLSIGIIILIIWYIYYQPNSESFITNPNITVYIVWNDKFNIQGLGDKLRGTIAIYQYCQAHNIPCFFDARFSTFGKYLVNGSTNPNPKITINTPVPQLRNIYNNPNALGDFISQAIAQSTDDYICLTTNFFPHIPLSISDMDFLNFIMKPTQELEDKINKIQETIPENYTIQHFRFLDKKEPDESKCEQCYQLLANTYQPTDILMSNSPIFKNYIKVKIPEICTIECDNCMHLHVGHNPSDLIIEFTLIEYNLIKKATSIKTYSQYKWTSAFVSWPARFYSIPIINTQI